MNIVISALLGIGFLLLGAAATFLMYYLWGFPFDKATRTSQAPKPLMRLHRILGYAYGAMYLFMMAQMVPRMWQYQVELPPRTVAHLLLGFLIGIILVIKIAIMRFFRHFEEWMPYLGTALFVCTALLMGLSLPAAYREGTLASAAVGGSVYSRENRKRVADSLVRSGLPVGTPIAELSTESSLRKGRAVLLDKCVRCHDLKTILAQPKMPADWFATVGRMAAKPALFAPITEREQQAVSAYLIAITPDLHGSKQKAIAEVQVTSPSSAMRLPDANDVHIVPVAKPQETFQKVCSQCHAADKVKTMPPHSQAEVQALLESMQGKGMNVTRAELASLRAYLTQTYVNIAK